MSVFPSLPRAFRPLSAVAALGLIAAPLLATAPADAAVAQPVDVVKVRYDLPVDVVKVRYDLPGRDPDTNTGFNQEYVELKNTSRQTVDLGGYTITDRAAKHRFVVPRGTRLAPGRSVQVRSGAGRNSATALYWGTRGYVWNNSGDTVTLRSARGQQIEQCSYAGGEGGGTKYC